MSWLLDGKPLRRILVTRLRYLGDVVMSTVVLEALRRGDPGITLGYLCEAVHGAVLAADPRLDRLHLLGSRRRGQDARARIRTDDSDPVGPHPPSGFWGTVRDLRAARYDLAVDLFFNPRSAWLLRLAGVKRRIGGTTGSRRHLYTHLARPEDMVDRQLAWPQRAPGVLGHHLSRLAPLVHAETGLGFGDWFEAHGPVCPVPALVTPPQGVGLTAALREIGLTLADPFILLAPGATWPSKAWPEKQWVELAQGLARNWNLPLVVLVPPGCRGDWPRLAAVASAGGGGSLPPLPLPDVLALVARARLLVTVDGGIMHAGVGLGTPTVAIFGPTDPEMWFPYEEAGPFRVVARRPACHPCHLHTCGEFICLPELEAGPVLETARALIAEIPSRPPDGER